jgi:hypothetical protein
MSQFADRIVILQTTCFFGGVSHPRHTPSHDSPGWMKKPVNEWKVLIMQYYNTMLEQNNTLQLNNHSQTAKMRVRLGTGKQTWSPNKVNPTHQLLIVDYDNRKYA